MLPAAAQLTIQGKVVSEDSGEPAADVTVVANKGAAATTTAEDGSYRLALPAAADTVLLEAYSLESYKYSQVLNTRGKTEVTVNITLRSKLVTTGIVTITESFSQNLETSTSSMATLSQDRLDVRATTTVMDALNQVPGIGITGGQISIRGSSGFTYNVGTRVLTLLNGMPVLSADRSSIDWQMMPVDMVRQVEVFKGAASVLYGAGAMGGVINVIMDEPGDTARTSIRTKLQWYGTPADMIGDWDGRSGAWAPSVNITHSRKVGRGWSTTILGDIIYDSGYLKDYHVLRGRVLSMNTFRFGKKLQGLKLGLDVQLGYDEQENVDMWKGFPDEALLPNRTFHNQYNFYKFNIDPKVSYTFRNTQLQYQGRVYLRWRDFPDPSTAKTIFNGIYYNDMTVNQRLWKDRIQIVGGFNHTRYSLGVNEREIGTGNTDQLALFAQVKLELLDKRLSIVAGGRLQYEQMSGDTATASNGGKFSTASIVTMLEPVFRGGVNYRAGRSTYLRASAGQAVRSPSLTERFITIKGDIGVNANPNIQLEKGFTAEVGVKQLFGYGKRNNWITGNVDVAGFMMQFNNMVEFYADQDYLLSEGKIALQAQNISKAYIYGVELNTETSFRLTSKMRLNVSGGFTYIEPIDPDGKRSWDGDDSTDAIIGYAFQALLGSGGGIDMPSDRPYTLKYRTKLTTRLTLGLDVGPFNFTVFHRYTSPMVNVDKLFLIDLLGQQVEIAPGVKITLDQATLDAMGLSRMFPGTRLFREMYNFGYHEIDIAAAWRFKTVTVSAHVFNLLNTTYATLAGQLGPQRSFALQTKFHF